MADANGLGQWECTVCGYIYDPRLHDGVEFGQVPASYRCPGCGYPKNVFRPRRSTGAHKAICRPGPRVDECGPAKPMKQKE